jgi:hypothetical protein
MTLTRKEIEFLLDLIGDPRDGTASTKRIYRKLRAALDTAK